MEQGDEGCGGTKPENHEEPVFANETSLPEAELTQRDRGPAGLAVADHGNLIARSGKNADGSFRRAQLEPAENNSSAHHSGCRKAGPRPRRHLRQSPISRPVRYHPRRRDQPQKRRREQHHGYAGQVRINEQDLVRPPGDHAVNPRDSIKTELAAAPIVSATAHDRDCSRHRVSSLSGFSGSTGFSRSPILFSGTSRLRRRDGQELRSGRVLQPHRKHSHNRQDHASLRKCLRCPGRKGLSPSPIIPGRRRFPGISTSPSRISRTRWGLPDSASRSCRSAGRRSAGRRSGHPRRSPRKSRTGRSTRY